MTALQKRKYGFLPLCVLMLGVFVGYWLFFGQSVFIGDRENQNNSDVEIGLWTSGTRIEQSFIASHDHLKQVDFFVKSFHPWATPLLECRLFEIETHEIPKDLTYPMLSTNMREVRLKRINGWLVSGHMFNRCTFDEPIPDSAGKRYLFSLKPTDLKKGGSSIVMSSSGDRYDEGNLFVDGKKKDNDLAFRALYQRSRWQLFRELVARITLQKPFPFSQTWFVYLLFLVYVSLMSVLMYYCFGRKWNS